VKDPNYKSLCGLYACLFNDWLRYCFLDACRGIFYLNITMGLSRSFTILSPTDIPQ
jgi:hypothetical protein